MPMEAQLCVGEDVIVVGGGNSAGQAAVFLAQTARRVHMLVRGEGLADTMSRYLIRRIEDNPAIVLRTHTQIVGLEGNGHLERVQWRDDRAGNVETKDIRHVFMMTGAVPNTDWLERCVALDDKGFIKTGPDLSPDDLSVGGLAAEQAALSSRNQSTRRLRGRRCAGRQCQARRLCGRRGIRLPSHLSTRCFASKQFDLRVGYRVVGRRLTKLPTSVTNLESSGDRLSFLQTRANGNHSLRSATFNIATPSGHRQRAVSTTKPTPMP